MFRTGDPVIRMSSPAPKRSVFPVADGVTENPMKPFVYEGERTREISFPLGGIGSGSIGLAGNGRLIDWEIFNRPNKRSTNGFSHFAIKAEVDEQMLDARVLNSDLMPPYSGGRSFGFGPKSDCLAGVPHFRAVEFEGRYPVADLRFKDEKFPGEVSMTAFNPYIPLNDVDSSIPGAFFEIKVKNTTKKKITYTVCLSVQNPMPKGTTVNVHGEKENVRFIKLSSKKFKTDEVEFGDMTIATDATDASYQEYWFRGGWFDNLEIYWKDLTSLGKLKNRRYKESTERIQDNCSLAAHFEVQPGETGKTRFVISWSFPNCYNYWNPYREGSDLPPKTWKNYYATLFRDSTGSAIYSLENWDRLCEETMEFRNALFSSTLPSFVLDAVSANLSILKTPTVLRLEDGSLYGWEGCQQSSGCCEGSCTHVWNYAYVVPFLFPKLERSMRELDFRYNQRENGRMSFRLQLPLGALWDFEHACVDGQFGGVIKSYCDWKISGDSSWLRSNWGRIKKSIEYAWVKTNEDKWDLDKDGILEGRQHHTLDMELFGPNSWLTGFYLASLKAGAEMAEYLGEKGKANEYRDLFKKGKEWADRHLFNGEYYHQIIDMKDRSILERFKQKDPNVRKTYWDEEHSEIKYQIAEGCEIDQVVAQWHASICGLGEIFDKEQTKKALSSIFRYNFKKSMREFFNPCRIFSLNDEAGLVICEWPKGKHKPVIPIPYAEESMNGFEYTVASHMIQEDLIEQGLEVVKAIRARYDGKKRNPWNEFECGSNYARSMSSYALLLALSGFQFDLVRGEIGFNPRWFENGNFSCFWSLGTGWGTFEIKPNNVVIRVQHGELKVKTLRLPFLKGRKAKTVAIGKDAVEFEDRKGEVALRKLSLIQEKQELKVQL